MDQIHLISATPGGGKTLRAVMLACQFMAENPDRPVYSNINGFTRAAPIPDEWMDCPDGSLIVLDECQQRWRRYRATGEPPPEIAALEMHRHRGIGFILTCQNPQQLTADVRALVGIHEHLMRKGRLDHSIVWRWEGVCHTHPSNHSRDADCEISVWRHPKKYYAEYRSASLQVGKKRLPRILVIAPVVFLAAIGSVTYAVAQVGSFFGGNQDAPVHVETAPSSSPSEAPPQASEVIAYGGLQHGDQCRLYDENGRLLRVSRPMCQEALDMGLPYPVELLNF